MSSDRDNAPKKTPPAGIAAQLAGPVDESSHRPTPIHGVQVVDDDVALSAIARRTAVTQNSSLNTLAGVEALRRETKADIEVVRADVTRAHDKIDGVLISMVHMQGTLGRSVGQNEQIIKKLDEASEQKRNTEHIHTVTKVAQVEVDTTRQKSEIEVDTEARKAKIDGDAKAREAKIDVYKKLALQVILGLGALLSAGGIGAALTKCSG